MQYSHICRYQRGLRRDYKRSYNLSLTTYDNPGIVSQRVDNMKDIFLAKQRIIQVQNSPSSPDPLAPWDFFLFPKQNIYQKIWGNRGPDRNTIAQLHATSNEDILEGFRPMEKLLQWINWKPRELFGRKFIIHFCFAFVFVFVVFVSVFQLDTFF